MKKSLKIVSIFCLIFLLYIVIVVIRKDICVKNVDKLIQTEIYAQEEDPMLKMETFLQGEKLIILDFTSEYCGACRDIKPILELAQSKYSHRAEFLYIDVDKNPEMANTFNVRLLPAVFAVDPKTRDIISLPVHEMQDELSFDNVFDQVCEEFSSKKEE